MANAEFVCAMEDVLEVYHRPYDETRPQVCLDETSKQLVGEVVQPISGQPGQPERFDYEYARNGTANLFMICEPLAGWRHVMVTERRTPKDFAEVLRWLAEDVYREAPQIVLVVDNLNTHKLASLYEAFDPARARRIAARFEVHHTPKHGSWLNVAEIELSVLARQCTNRRIESQDELLKQLEPWELKRNDREVGVNWRVNTADARIKLRRLYPSNRAAPARQDRSEEQARQSRSASGVQRFSQSRKPVAPLVGDVRGCHGRARSGRMNVW